MAVRDLGGVLKDVQTLFSAGTMAALSDDYLLDSFLSPHEDAAEVAFEALVRRHGPMVLRICRDELRDAHAAEDAFQVTFLVLARRAGSIRNRGSVASWLFGVARRVSKRAKVERSAPGSSMSGEACSRLRNQSPSAMITRPCWRRRSMKRSINCRRNTGRPLCSAISRA